jgi:hypothetical protein
VRALIQQLLGRRVSDYPVPCLFQSPLDGSAERRIVVHDMNDAGQMALPGRKCLLVLLFFFSAFSLGIMAGQSPLEDANDVTLPSAIKFAAEAHSPG